MLFAEDVEVHTLPWTEHEDQVLVGLVKSRGGEGKWDRKGLPPCHSMLAVLTGAERRTPADVAARVRKLLRAQAAEARAQEQHAEAEQAATPGEGEGPPVVAAGFQEAVSEGAGKDICGASRDRLKGAVERGLAFLTRAAPAG